MNIRSKHIFISALWLLVFFFSAVPHIAYADTEFLYFDPSWTNGVQSQIHSSPATLYRATGATVKNVTVCVNAGHGTKGGSDVRTLCHPDGSPKVTGGSTAAGATYATAVSTGTTMLDGIPEATVTLRAAQILKEELLSRGYHVLMIRETDDVQLDNIARTLLANYYADCHISLHYDSTTDDRGAYFCGVPNVDSYRNMEPVRSHWQEHQYLGESLIAGLRSVGRPIRGSGNIPQDLTQTSYSTVPSVDLEIGDRASDHTDATLSVIAQGIANGLDAFSADFIDVAQDAYYYTPVQWAISREITTGASAIRFSPDASCSRGQMMTFLWRLAGSPSSSVSTTSFFDVPATAYYASAVRWAVAQEITTGTDRTTFSPDATVTRGQVVSFLYRLAHRPSVLITHSFTDVAPDAYYASAVQWAVDQGITTGVDASTFQPDAPCTRGQAVTFLYRYTQQ